jgi:hypothetical protein
MIIVRLMGGLGNQMYQYALGRNLALSSGAELKLDTSHYKHDPKRTYALNTFNISAKKLTLSEAALVYVAKNIMKRYSYTSHQGTRYDESVFSLQDNVILDGYWQSEKYFKNIRTILLEDFTLTKPPDTKNQKVLEKIQAGQSVCLHIRRGDYATNPSTNSFHGLCSMSYYYNALKRLSENVEGLTVFVFSDDILWARTNLKIAFPTVFVDINSQEQSFMDMVLMSHCKHFIIANSSFSWWPAWLARYCDKLVYAPERWFITKDEGDIVPDEWIRIQG